MIQIVEVTMGSLYKNSRKQIFVPLFLILFCSSVPTLIWSAGYQEEKLFDGDFYTTEDLRGKIEFHNQEIDVLEKEIKGLNTDIDWLVLKINQIQDAGRSADSNLKKSISSKEKKVITLLKNKNRLEYLVQYYASALGSKKESTLEDILMKKAPSLKSKNPMTLQKESNIQIQQIIPKNESTQVSMYPEVYNDITKDELQTAINSAGLNDWVEVIGSGTCLRLETTLPILFPTGSAKVATEYTSFFRKLAGFLKPYDVKILVNGYADTVPIKNTKYAHKFINY